LPDAIGPLSCVYVCLSVCLSVLSVCDVGVLWPNGFMHQNETWHGGRPRPRPHCVRWGPSSPPPKGAQPSPILAHVCSGQTARWMKMPLSTEVSLSPSDIVLGLDGDPAPPPKRDKTPNFRPMPFISVCLNIYILNAVRYPYVRTSVMLGVA